MEGITWHTKGAKFSAGQYAMEFCNKSKLRDCGPWILRAKRGLIVIGATVLGLCFGIFVALIQTGLERMMDDPEISEKIALLKRALSAKRTIGP